MSYPSEFVNEKLFKFVDKMSFWKYFLIEQDTEKN